MDLLKQVEPHLHLIDLAQRNDVGDPYKKVKIDLKDQKDFVYVLNVVERFAKQLLSNGRIWMGKAIAGNGRRIGLFVSTWTFFKRFTTPKYDGHFQHFQICGILPTMWQKIHCLHLKMVYTTLWSVTKHPDVWIQRAVDITLVDYPGLVSPNMSDVYESSGESGTAKYHSLRTLMEGLTQGVKETINSTLNLFCNAYMSATSKKKSGYDASIPFVIVNNELCNIIPG